MTAPPPGAPVAAVALSQHLAGRDRELRLVDDALVNLADGPSVVVIRGEAGIGKSTLWRTGVERARRRGYTTLVARAAEDELPGPVVGLVDLFERTDGSAPALASDIGPFERGNAVAAILRRLAATAPVVVAIDDVQWLDPVSAVSLRFCLSRLSDEPVMFLATRRTEPAGSAGAAGSGEDSALFGDRVTATSRQVAIGLGPLSNTAIREVVAPIIGSVPKRSLDQLCAVSAGNPMYAIELARAFDRFDAPLHASVPPTLRGAVLERLAGVGPAETTVLQVAAALGPSPADLIVRAAAIPGATAVLDRAVAHGWLVAEGGTLRFAHPLVASAVVAAVNPIDRQALHARLAHIVADPDARARHLALSCTEPDAEIASELSAAARRAARNGAPAFASELADHAVRITPPADVVARVRRRFVGILHRAAAGERTAALADTDALIAALPAGPARAEAVSLRVAIDFAGGERYLQQALLEAGPDELLRGRILELRGWMATTYRADPGAGIDYCQQALDIATRLNDPRLEMLAAGSVATASLMLGRPRPQLIERALQLADEHPGPALGRWPQGVYGQLCIWCGHLDRARPLLEELYRTCVAAGTEFQRPYRLLDLALLELAAGNVGTAADLTEDGGESATDAGNDQAVAWLAYPAGLAAVHAGDPSRAAGFASVLRSRGTEHDGRTRAVMASHVLGLNALASGNPAAALAALEPGVTTLRDIGLQLPSVIPVLPDAIEAAAGAGDPQRCDDLATELSRQAHAVDQPWVSAAACRGRGLAALAAADAVAPELLGDAAAMFGKLGYRLDAARTMVHHARALRRAGQRTAAGVVIDDAMGELRAMGATGWLTSHADVSGASASSDVPLTPTEKRIGDLVASGRRNREIAGELAMSVGTVEAHLTRIYRKFHVRSRIELARIVRSS